ncbi:unnamed protein product [Hermetia illucens]|uniref:Nuclear receptor domain-containing protein n=2 Tax=Hermetia illucens TaxID=343691 RepID=A0A7R8UII3_HERIL|nr:knirps-related protein isoform X2 [Hermetia illucens]XP_037907658.1 knirps-related protein isoform X2 [Hermetia illucens]XP_037907659.1 knirps-related protein isoform X2 [Hermetia illucens]CAD7081295.1 unnamed protein product [Hermetia illucens]
MNQTCKVCGEPAAGFHFGAFTCEGCKSFFGRSYNNLSSISECKNNGECVINKKNRTACKACRLRKCLLVGMSKSGSRYGRRSNWFKIHCLLQEQQQQAAAAAAAHNNHNSQKTPPPPPATLAMLGHPGVYPPGLYPPRPNCTKEELMLLGLDDYKHPAASPSVSSPDSHNSDSSIDVNVRSNTLLRLGKPMDANSMSKDLFLPLPFPGLSSLPVMPPPGFIPPSHLLFPGYHPALYPHHQGLLKPAAEHQHLLSNSHLANNNSRYALNHNNNNHINSISNNNNLNNNHIQNNTKAAEELTKRFYLDAVLKSQQRSPVATTTVTTTTYTTTPTPMHSDSISSTKKDHHVDDDQRQDDHPTSPHDHHTRIETEDESVDGESEELVVAMTPPRSPRTNMQDDPIDLSMKTGSSHSSKSSIASIDDNRHLSGGESDAHSEDNDDDDETTTTTITTTIQKRPQFVAAVANNISEDEEETEYERDMKRMKMQVTTTPLDLTTRV